MMVKACLNCGALPLPRARYCRQCGIPLIAPFSTEDDADEVSPRAPTVPFEPELTDTDDINDARTGRGPNETNRMIREEFDALLLRGDTARSVSHEDATPPPEPIDAELTPASGSSSVPLREGDKGNKGNESRGLQAPQRARFSLKGWRLAAAVSPARSAL